MSDDTRNLRQFLAPRFWGVWIGFAALRAVSVLPFGWQMAMGRGIGRLAMRLSKSRRRIASRNLRLCFPDLSDDARRAMVVAHFESLGMSIFEMAMAYYRPQRFDGRINLHGYEKLEQAMQGNVILLTAHFGALEVGGIALKQRGLVFDAVFRKDRDPLVTELIRRGRENTGRRTIEKANIKQMVRSLREGVPVWYAPDQSYRRKQSELLPFMGVAAMTNTATTGLAKLGKATVVGFFPHRNADCSGYDIDITAPLPGVPSDDASSDTLRIMQLIETHVRRSPAQYFWVHRRFKERGESLPDAYASLADEDDE